MEQSEILTKANNFHTEDKVSSVVESVALEVEQTRNKSIRSVKTQPTTLNDQVNSKVFISYGFDLCPPCLVVEPHSRGLVTARL